MTTRDGASMLRARIDDLATCVRAVADDVPCAVRTTESFAVTGIGASEGPARAMAAMLRSTWRVRASFVPMSAFAIGERAEGDVLIVFSQSLSPNACLALDRSTDFARAILVTSTREPARADAAHALQRFRARGEVIVVPSRSGAAANAVAREHGTLVRVLGPAIATLAAARWVGAASTEDVASLVDALSSAPERARAATEAIGDGAFDERIAFVSAGDYGELCFGIATLWLETLYAPRPPIFDVLQIAHGPFQSFYPSPFLLVALERGGAEKDLFDRLARLLDPTRHTLVRLTTSLPSPLASIDHFAQVAHLLSRVLDARPRDLTTWPGAGRDGPLYDLGADYRIVKA